MSPGLTLRSSLKSLLWLGKSESPSDFLHCLSESFPLSLTQTRYNYVQEISRSTVLELRDIRNHWVQCTHFTNGKSVAKQFPFCTVVQPLSDSFSYTQDPLLYKLISQQISDSELDLFLLEVSWVLGLEVWKELRAQGNSWHPLYSLQVIWPSTSAPVMDQGEDSGRTSIF